jgi:hypothetical protein
LTNIEASLAHATRVTPCKTDSSVKALVPASDTTPADWVIAGLRGFAESVESIVPAGFASYVRVFHPAYRRGGDSFRPVRWTEVAAANQKRAHVGMQFDLLIGSDDLYTFVPQPGVFDQGPQVGSLPREQIELLVPVLGRHTATPQTCWFASWEGWGGIRADVASAPKFQPAPRSYHLLAGPIESASESMSEHSEQSASVWWPDDHAWCVATEIDFNTTYVGCDDMCRDELLRTADVEAFVVDPAARGYEAW